MSKAKLIIVKSASEKREFYPAQERIPIDASGRDHTLQLRYTYAG